MIDIPVDKRPVPKALLAIFVLLVTVIGMLGWGYFRSERNRVRRDAETNLGAIADLKAAQLAEWRRERMADGNVIMADGGALEKLARVIDGSDESGGTVKIWLETLRAQYGYHAAFVLDLEGREHLAVGSHEEHMGEDMPERIATCLEQGRPLFTEMHRAERSDHPHIGLLVPLITPHVADSEPFGLLVLRIDPFDFLFPFIQAWPTPSPTAETLLVCRDGDDVLFLNELRHQSGTAMALRIPVSRTDLPAARAVQGFSGSVQGEDYRGEPVLAAVRAIPGTDWHLVSKIDVDDIDTPLRRVTAPLFASMIALIVAAGAGLGFVWRRQNGVWLEQQVEAERQRADAESDLRRAQEQFRTYFDESLVGMAITSPKKGWMQANKRLCDMLGYTFDELRKTTWPELTHPEDLAADVTQFERLLAGEIDGYSLDKRFVRKDSSVVPTILSVRAVRHSDGAVDYVLAQLQDVTHRKRAMTDLEASEARFRQLLTLAPIPMAHVNEDGQLIFVNNRFTELLGYDLNDVPDLDAWWQSAYPDPEYRESVQKTWTADIERAAEQGTDIRSREYRLTCKDGTVRVAEIGGVVIGDEFMATVVDRTEQRKAVVALAENERRYRGIFHTAPVSIWEEDWSGVIAMLDGLRREAAGDIPAYLAGHPDFVEKALKEVRVLDVNAETMSMFGAADKAQMLASLETVFATPDTLPGFVGELCALADGEQFYKTEMRLCTVHGDRIHVLLTMAFPDVGTGSGTVLVSLMDLSERKRHEEAQATLTEELARKNRELAQVIYVASHDLRSPLVNVQGFSRELKASIEDVQTALADQSLTDEAAQQVGVLLEEDIPESLNFILNSVSQMDRLLSGLLAISRLGRTAQTMTELDMGVLVRDVVDTLDFQIREKDGSVDIDPLPVCRGDAGQMEQVFQNLVGNAVKYAAPDRPLAITISGEQRDGEALYCVADNGQGIAPQYQEKVFELFHRLAPGESQGDGLGLTTVRTAMDRHGGRVWLESVPGEGSRFYIAVPIHDEDERAWRENRTSTTKNETEAGAA